ncbi:MAG: hypothetical protein L0219_19435 [Phycisphaerales bacterium]|nr:hypothetical protein [Phycisphaerales bacterium]
MRLFYDNLIDAAVAGNTLFQSSQDNAFPAANVINQLRKKPWRTGATLAQEWVYFDFGVARTVQAIVVLDHTLTSGDSGIMVQGNTTAVFTSPAFSQTLTWSSGLITQTFLAQSYRFWRFVFTKSSASQTRDVGRLFIGPYTDAETPDYDGWDRDEEDLSTVIRTVGGQVFSEARNSYRMASLKFTNITETKRLELKALSDRVGRHTNFFAVIDPTASGEVAEAVYVKLRDKPKMKVSGFDAELLWSGKLDLEELL